MERVHTAASRVASPTDLGRTGAALACLFAGPLAAGGRVGAAGVVLGLAAALRGTRRIPIVLPAPDVEQLLPSLAERYAEAAPLLGLLLAFRGQVVPTSVVALLMLGAVMDAFVRAKAGTLGLRLRDAALPVGRLVFLAGALVLGAILDLRAGATTWSSRPVTTVLLAFGAMMSHYGACKLALETRRWLRWLAAD